jgi:hypothetical protein
MQHRVVKLDMAEALWFAAGWQELHVKAGFTVCYKSQQVTEQCPSKARAMR